MSVAGLDVDILSATLHLPADIPAGGPDEPLDAAGAGRWLDRLQAGLATTGLARAMATANLPPGRWYLRRVDLPVRLEVGRPEIALVTDWAEQLVAAVRRTTLAGGPHVVHYQDDEAAIGDLVRGVVGGDHRRAWAWAAAGVVRGGDPDLVARPRDALLAVAARHPGPALVAVLEVLRGPGGLAALDRLLGPAGWARLAGLVAGAAPVASVATPPAGAPVPASPAGPGRDAGNPAVATLAEWIVGASAVARQVQRSPLRPGPAVLAALALLVVADADPGSLHRTVAPLVAEVAARLAPIPSAAPGAFVPPAAAAPEVAAAGRADPAAPGHTGSAGRQAGGPGAQDPPAAAASPAGSPAPDQDAEDRAEAETGWPTGWAGLAFLLAVAGDAGLPAAALEEPPLAGRPLRWVLWMLAGQVVPVAGDDPARLLLAGLTPDRADAVLREPRPDEDEAVALAGLAAVWAAAAAARLTAAGAEPAGDPDRSVVLTMARRPGVVRGGLGWLEVELPLSHVELSIRCAGLDLDPGWVPWLGTVVRYRYA
ncbi:MAG TPA: hypothetical protein VHK02_08180 [Actinomycetota bacterium]|jgi:hypothetical protein|nr:hypothetical protein [Actinomycetota bacterium]